MIRRIGSELVYIGWQSAIEIVATLSGRRLGLDAGWIGRSRRRLRWAGAAATGGFCWGKEKATARLDCATFSISGWCFADWFVGSCFSVAERCRQASPLSRKFTGSDAAQWLSL